MSEFDSRAREWDKDKIHQERSEAIAAGLERMIPFHPQMSAMEYGAGTGLLGFLLRDKFAEITLMDSSREMIEVCNEKVEHFKTSHVKPVWFDLVHNDYDSKFDVIFNQMVLHHVTDIDFIFEKFYSMLRVDGYLAIADLFPEDGSFHGPEVKVHWGFDPAELVLKLKSHGFKTARFEQGFNMKRESGRIYPIFLLVAQK